MPTDATYVEMISQHDRAGLCDLWEAIVEGNTPGWGPGKAFEYLVIRAFQMEDAHVRWPYKVRAEGESGDVLEQIDGAVYADGLACLVESKDTKERIDIEPIAKLRNQLLRRPGSAVGIVFSRSGFTDPALALARFAAPQTVLLWYGDELAYALYKERMRASLLDKYRFCIEQGLPSYNTTVEDLP